ncbi:MAG TPA: diacylglycerol kinase family protein [Novosphingobium sp.]
MLSGRTIWLVTNPASGSNDEAALSALDQAFQNAGFRIGRKLAFHQDGPPEPEDLRAAGIDLVAVFTGDGTINAVVTGLYGWDGAVLVLPGGTMNLLAGRLHGDADAAEIIARAGAGKARRRRPQIVRSRWGDGLTGILAGPGTSWNDVREAMREADVLGLVSSAAEAIGESTGSPKVVCRDPACGRSEGYSLIMVTPEDDALEVDGYYAESFADYAKQGIALLRRNFRDGPHEWLGRHPTLRLACAEGGPMGLLIDGEPREGAAMESFTLAPCEVDLLATADVR